MEEGWNSQPVAAYKHGDFFSPLVAFFRNHNLHIMEFRRCLSPSSPHFVEEGPLLMARQIPDSTDEVVRKSETRSSRTCDLENGDAKLCVSALAKQSTDPHLGVLRYRKGENQAVLVCELILLLAGLW